MVKKLLMIFISGVLLLTACGSSTEQAASSSEPDAGGINEQSAGQAAGDITATALQNANCRYGPDTSFPVIMPFDEGMTGIIVAQNHQLGDWYLLRTSDGTECWVSADLLSLSADASDVWQIVSYPTPTTAPASSLWAGTWTFYSNGCDNNAQACDISNPITIVAVGSNAIAATFLFTLDTMTANATLSADGMTATGTMTGGYQTFDIHWVMDANGNQFRGSINRMNGWDNYFCASRNGASRPEPCRT